MNKTDTLFHPSIIYFSRYTYSRIRFFGYSSFMNLVSLNQKSFSSTQPSSSLNYPILNSILVLLSRLERYAANVSFVLIPDLFEHLVLF